MPSRPKRLVRTASLLLVRVADRALWKVSVRKMPRYMKRPLDIL